MINKKSKIGLGIILGGIAGVVAGLFASEKPGKQLRQNTKTNYDKIVKALSDKNLDKKVEKIFGEYSQEFKIFVEEAKQDMAQKLNELQETATKIDRSKYSKLLNETVSSVSKKQKLPKATLTRLKSYLANDLKKFQKLTTRKALKKTKKTAVKKVAKKTTKKS